MRFPFFFQTIIISCSLLERWQHLWLQDLSLQIYSDSMSRSCSRKSDFSINGAKNTYRLNRCGVLTSPNVGPLLTRFTVQQDYPIKYSSQRGTRKLILTPFQSGYDGTSVVSVTHVKLYRMMGLTQGLLTVLKKS